MAYLILLAGVSSITKCKLLKLRVNLLSGVWIAGSIHGLICFRFNDNASIFLWNPATREVRQVLEGVNISEPRGFHVGFGFSSIVNDYKIVRLHFSMISRFIRSKNCLLGTNPISQVHVYSLSTRSWKEIEFGNLDGVSLMSNGFPANGAIFWLGFMLGLGKEDEIDGYLIVSFDIATEVFTVMPLPSSSALKSDRNRLTVHEDKLALLCHTTIGDYEFSLIDLWVMEEGTDASGERWNWTKKYSTSPYPYLLDPRTIWRNEIVCNFLCSGVAKFGVSKGEGKDVCFNVATNEFKTFAIPKYGDGVGSFFNYVESLISVGNNHIEEV